MNQPLKNATEWYGVKLLHKFTVTGKPEQDKLDEFFHNTEVFFEESVRLIKASSFEEAYHLTETDAQKENTVYENKYGQTVKQEFFKSIDCYHLFESPQSYSEIYSTFFQAGQGENTKSLLDGRYTACSVDELHLLRQK